MSEQANWVVITGGPCSGKTTVINNFADRGFYTAPEVARAYLNKLMKNGVDVHAHKASLTLQKKIVSLKLARENVLQTSQQILFDRGLPDSLAYFSLHGLDLKGVLDVMNKRRYKQVFFLETLPLVNDDIRKEDIHTVTQLTRLIFDAYISLDYDPIRVPVMGIKERYEFIKSNLR